MSDTTGPNRRDFLHHSVGGGIALAREYAQAGGPARARQWNPPQAGYHRTVYAVSTNDGGKIVDESSVSPL
jgi:hypothetical protein